MPLILTDTSANKMHIFDESMTMKDVMDAIEFRKYHLEQKKKYKQPYVPTGNRPGRPKKSDVAVAVAAVAPDNGDDQI